ncbi:alpha/beta hydrolase [Flavobacterium akiainvivens]|uniref:Alpha/beta hydrolase n=1 Tax=Flavobacterium akiainvivens TaxID=1202724 RepID=A0A0M9VJ98_9FLAO|nr:DUF4180 domain-containing protein [Flavobacterium akiainvivens]KOS07489.1 alpha/beta hydrolase [Flavobacterium akiainvivens]SFQ63559.1 protein of unknown function [Flavobacterium akiainvivens]
MDTITHHLTTGTAAEISSAGTVIPNIQDGIDLMGNLYYQGFDKIIIHQANIIPAFFDLKTGIAGEILQKFSTYRVRLAIVSDFSHYQSKSLADFIYECNNGRQVNFVASVQEALDKFND